MAFVLAASGSAIGLGNIWKFPYITGLNGGGAFVLVYLMCIAAVGLPIFIAELFIGRDSQCNAVTAFEELDKKSTPWRYVGFVGVLSAFMILSFYSVVGGWVVNFAFKSLTGQFAGQTDEAVKGIMSAMFADGPSQIMWHTLFMIVTISIVIGGVKGGIERANKVLMPTLLGILFLLLINAVFSEGFSESLVFLFSPDFSKLTGEAILEAVGHSFFTLSLGMGTMITYGSYLQKTESLPRIALTVAFMDTAIALLAGLVIFSAVFSYGFEPGSGPTLMFQTLPILFNKMPGGQLISVGFFVLVAFAAVTSAVSLLEVVVAYVDEKFKWPRLRSTLVIGAVIYCTGILCALSFNMLSHVQIFGVGFFDLFDIATSKFTLPIGGLLISLFFGWVLGPKAVERAIDKPVTSFLTLGLVWATRLIAPIAVAVTLWHGIRDML
jgi:NSS family neurotransmitter:Na+ symporter